MDNLNLKIGILGGGQLGKMLYQAGSKMGLNISILENSLDCPASGVCPHISIGDIKKYEDVMAFGQDKDIITIEIENVNLKALFDLEKSGVKVYPKPQSLEIIKDKGLQKEFYKKHSIPTTDFQLFNSKEEVIQEVLSGNISWPFVQKSRTEGYDGKGVVVVLSESDLSEMLDAPCVIEDLADIDKEVSVIVAKKSNGDMVSFPAVEMEFHPTANLVEFLFSPSSLTSEQEATCDVLARSVARRIDIVGLLAVEMFLTKKGNILVNEVAPRPHNSGHHTIEACVTSQYEMHLRAIMDLPLGDTSLVRPAVMINLLGEPDYEGPTYYQNIDQALKISGVYPHLYGKTTTKPYRKMGHVTIVDTSLESAKEKARIIQKTLKVISKS